MRPAAMLSGLALLLPMSAGAQDGGPNPAFKSGAQLYQACTAPPDSNNMNFCLGYVMGISDSLQSMKLTCSPKEMTAKQLVDLVVNRLRDHANAQQYVAAQEVTLALAGAFPCRK